MSQTTSVARLRVVLAEHFDSAPAVLRAMREAELIAHGRPGRDGVCSAPVDARTAALVLLALASGAEPFQAPAAALRLSAFRLRYIDSTRASNPNPTRRRVDADVSLSLWDVLTADLRGTAGEIVDHEPVGWIFGRFEVVRAALEGLVFQPDEVPHAGEVTREVKISSSVLRQIAELFSLPPAELTAAAMSAAHGVVG